MNKTHTCPLLKTTYSGACKVSSCPFHSVENDSGCFYGESINNIAYARHKGTKNVVIKHEMERIETVIVNCVKLLSYANFCGDGRPTTHDLKLYNKVRLEKPYNLRPFCIITLKKFARMRNEEAFAAFKKTGVRVSYGLERFLMDSKLYEV